MQPLSQRVRHADPVRSEGAPTTSAAGDRLQDSSPGFTEPEPPNRGHWRLVVFLARLAVAVGLLAAIFSRIDLRTANVNPNLTLVVAVAVATGLLLLSQGVSALRWRIVLGDDRLRWGYLFRLYVIGSFFSLFLPTSVGGDGVRAAAVARSSTRAGRAMASVLIDRGLGVLAALVYVAAGLSLAPRTLDDLVGSQVTWHWPGWAVAGLVVVSAGVAATLVARSGRFRQVWCDGLTTLADLTRSPRGLVGLSGLALVSQALIIVLWYTLARGMNLALPAATFLWAVPLVALGSLLPVSVSGLGVREAVWLALLARSPVSHGSVVAFSLLYFVCTALVGVLGGILFAVLGIAPPAADSVVV